MPITGSGRILLMDDDGFVRETANEMLHSLGYQATTVTNSAEAIEVYKKARESGRPFDAVIMDLTIPDGVGGKKAIQKLMEIDPGVRAIVSSGYSRDPVMANFRSYGFRGVIAKPYKLTELSRALHEVLTN